MNAGSCVLQDKEGIRACFPGRKIILKILKKDVDKLEPACYYVAVVREQT
jgi:hypothetical protein